MNKYEPLDPREGFEEDHDTDLSAIWAPAALERQKAEYLTWSAHAGTQELEEYLRLDQAPEEKAARLMNKEEDCCDWCSGPLESHIVRADCIFCSERCAADWGCATSPQKAQGKPWTPQEHAEDLRASWTGIPTPSGDPAFQALWDEHRRTCLERKREAEEHEAQEADWMMREIVLTARIRRLRREALGAEVIAGLEAALILGVGIGYWWLK